MTSLDAGTAKVAEFCREEVHRKAQREQDRPRVSEGPVSPSRSGPRRELAAQMHMMRLSLRWLVESEAARAPVTKSTLQKISGWSPLFDRSLQHGSDHVRRPRQAWLDTPRAIAQAVAIEAMRKESPEEAKEYARFQAEAPGQITDAFAKSDKAGKKAQLEVMRLRAVFLSRFFPVPAPDQWTTDFWSPEQTERICRILARKLEAVKEPARPEWYPDGWRDSLAAFGGGR